MFGLLFLSAGVQGCSDDDQSLRSTHEAQLSFVSVGLDTLAYLDINPRQAEGTLVLLHGIPSSSLLYRATAPDIARATGWRVVAVDLLGFGASDKPDRDGSYTVQMHAARLLELLDSLGIASFVLGVHDIGGFIGWEMLSQDPTRIEGLVVANTTAYSAGLTPAPRVVDIVAGRRTPREVWADLDDPEFAKLVAAEFLELGFSQPSDVTDELVTAYAGPLSEGSSEAFIQFFEGTGPLLMDEPARRERFRDYDGPVI
ncbi:MAG: alpha/beta fold hydrolase, partial [Myxococcota bacterium]